MPRRRSKSPNDIESNNNIVIVTAEPIQSDSRKVKRLLSLGLIAFMSMTFIICITSKAVNNTFIPQRPSYRFNLSIQLSPEDYRAIEIGESTLKLSLGKHSVQAIVPPQNVLLKGDMGIVSGTW